MKLKHYFVILGMILMMALTGCGREHQKAASTSSAEIKPLPSPSMNEDSMFGVDDNINMATIDQWLGREDVAYRDVRMLFDPAAYEDIGGDADLSQTLEGFKIVPYPYVATLQSLPVEGAYEGDHLFDIEWSPEGKVLSAIPRYKESMIVLEDLFPKDQAIFLMCGGGGYAGMMKEVLLFLGWDSDKLYNIGGQWEYQGSHALELKRYPEAKEDTPVYASWNADYAYWDFGKLHAADENTRNEVAQMIADKEPNQRLEKETDRSQVESGSQEVEENTSSDSQSASFPELTYVHYSSGGTAQDYKAVILFEQSNDSFTSYQVAFASCTCRDPIVNYYSVCYVELLNSKRNAEEAAIRSITFRNNQGLYGDSNPNYYIAEYTEDYMHENFIDKLVGVSMEDMESFQGYGSWVDAVDVDAISGATVTTSNVQSMLKSLFAYHAKKYYES